MSHSRKTYTESRDRLSLRHKQFSFPTSMVNSTLSPQKKDILFLTRQKGYTSGTSHSIRICSHSFPIFALLNGKLSLSMLRRKQSPIQHNTYGRIKTFKCMNGGCCIGSQQVYIFIRIAYSKNRLPSSKLMPFPRKL